MSGTSSTIDEKSTRGGERDRHRVVQPPPSATRRRGPLGRFIVKHGIAYVFIAPAVLFLVALLLLPIIDVFINSVYRLNLLRPDATAFVGLDNFATALAQPQFWLDVRNGVIWTFGSVLGEFVVGLCTALLLHQKVRGLAFFRAIMIAPWVVPIVVAAMTWSWILNADYGVLNAMLSKLGLISQNIDWLGNQWTAMFAVINANIWRSFPFWTLSYLAVLQTVDQSELEAAEMDGANVFQRFWHITLPKLKGVTLILGILNVIWVFNNFDFIWLMTQGGPLDATQTLAIRTYLLAFSQYHFGQASAVAVIMMLILAIIIGLYFWVEKRRRRRLDHGHD